MSGSVISSTRPLVRSYLFHLCAVREVRGFGDRFAVIILPAYLSTLGYTLFQIGLVATSALPGSSLLGLAVGFFTPRNDLRTLLILGAGLVAGGFDRLLAFKLTFCASDHVGRPFSPLRR